MKNKIVYVLCLFLIISTCLTACVSSDAKYTEGKVKVTFDLQGGEYKNSNLPVSFYFDFEQGTQNLIKDMFALSTDKLTRNGYEVEGWYTSDSFSAESKWDFSSDKVGDEGVTLYAHWQPLIKYTYQIYYVDSQGVEQKIGSPYIVSAGATFSDTLKYSTKKKPSNTTFLKFVDENGNDWDETFVHPGGESDCEIKVYAQYITGIWTLVSTSSEFTKAVSASAKIYLLNDITIELDRKGAKQSINFGNFTGAIEGNGYTVSNFAVKYDPSKDGLTNDVTDNSPNVLYVSLFGNMNGAVVKDISFSDVVLDIKTNNSMTSRIYVAPLFTNATNCEVENVNMTYTYTCTQTPWDDDTQLKEQNYITYLENGYNTNDGNTSITHVVCTQTNK